MSPYVSKAQQGYFHAHKKELESQGVNVNEWDKASKGKKLPERKSKTRLAKSKAKLLRAMQGKKK